MAEGLMAEELSSSTFFDPDTTRITAIRRGLRRLQTAPRGITSLPFLSAAEIDLLVTDAQLASYRTATPEIEHLGQTRTDGACLSLTAINIVVFHR